MDTIRPIELPCYSSKIQASIIINSKDSEG